MEKTLIIGVAGGSGSGKSTIVNLLSERFGKDVTVILHDNYYKAHHEMTYDERCKLNYDCPDAFDNDLFAKQLEDLRNGKAVFCPVYDYKIHDRSDETVEIKPNKVILIDGILVLAEKKIRDLLDIKIFVDTDADIRILRRINRDMNERKRSLESIMSQYINTVKPMHEAYVEPSKRYADMIIPDGCNIVALDILEKRISADIKAGEKK